MKTPVTTNGGGTWSGGDIESIGINATAQVSRAPAWDAMAAEQYAATLLAGPGSAKLGEIVNVLLISEGLDSNQSDDWAAIGQDLAESIGKERVHHPYDLFLANNSINIWSVFLPSREKGASILYEVRVNQQAQGLTASDMMPTPFIPTDPTAAWQVEMMLAQCGLPTRADVPPAGDQARQDRFNNTLANWQTIYGSDRVPASKATLAIWESWIGWWFRTLLDERDNVLGVSFGNRPSFSRDSPDRVPSLHPLRTKRADLDKFLAKITDGVGGPVIGQVWGANGKDAGYVIALIAGARYGGVESPRNLVCATLTMDRLLNVSLVDQGTFRYVPLPFDLPRNIYGFARVGADARGTVLHELSHAFNLQDEYTEHALSLPAGRSELLNQGNVMPETELQTAGKLDGSKLRWRWPRIAKAATVSAAITKQGANFVIPLRKGQASRFAAGDSVFVRRRPLLNAPKSTEPQVVTLAKMSDALSVVEVPPDADQIVVSAPASFVAKDFAGTTPFESIVIVPVPAPTYAAAANPPDRFAELAPRIVRDWITQQDAPLDRKHATACSSLALPDQTPDLDPRAVLANVPDKVNPFWLGARQWIGAFDGGVTFSCGVFHPSNQCMMNNHHELTATFCWVCAYLLVDAIDPSLHGDIDNWYSPGYIEPQP